MNLPAEELPRISPAVMNVFAAYSRRYVRRHFRAIRISKCGLPRDDDSRPLVVYLNHAAWWDPLVCLLLSREFFPRRNSFAAIDAAMLKRYRFFKRLGFFGVERQKMRGARAFLRTSLALLHFPRNALWLTPQARFVDVRERPLRLQGGLGSLAALESGAAFVPLAIEYAFWTEPRQEILVSFGEPIVPAAGPSRTADEWTQTFTAALEATQDELAARSCRRDLAEWSALNRGRAGFDGVYDAWLRLRARLSRRRFVSQHHEETER
jgi:1-acyl-sn-glycerol-3-phosphate acyltransferase